MEPAEKMRVFRDRQADKLRPKDLNWRGAGAGQAFWTEGFMAGFSEGEKLGSLRGKLRFQNKMLKVILASDSISVSSGLEGIGLDLTKLPSSWWTERCLETLAEIEDFLKKK